MTKEHLRESIARFKETKTKMQESIKRNNLVNEKISEKITLVTAKIDRLEAELAAHSG